MTTGAASRRGHGIRRGHSSGSDDLQSRGNGTGRVQGDARRKRPPSSRAGTGNRLWSKRTLAGAHPFGRAQEISGRASRRGRSSSKATNGNRVGQELKLSNKATASGSAVHIRHLDPDLQSTQRLERRHADHLELPVAAQRNPDRRRHLLHLHEHKADTEPPSSLQCEAIAEDEEGQRGSRRSLPRPTRPEVPRRTYSPWGSRPTVDFENQTSGPVAGRVGSTRRRGDLDLQGAWHGAGAAPKPCSAKRRAPPARALTSLAPGDSYEPLEVVIALGENPPTRCSRKPKSRAGAPRSRQPPKTNTRSPKARSPSASRPLKSRSSTPPATTTPRPAGTRSAPGRTSPSTRTSGRKRLNSDLQRSGERLTEGNDDGDAAGVHRQPAGGAGAVRVYRRRGPGRLPGLAARWGKCS